MTRTYHPTVEDMTTFRTQAPAKRDGRRDADGLTRTQT